MTRSGRFPRALVLWAVLFSLGGTGVGAVGATQPVTTDPLRIIPADALFCVRLNRLSTTLTQMDQFLTGVSPVGLSMPVQAKLGALLGAPQPAGVNMAGDFAVFGPLPGGERPDLKRVGVLVPLSNLQQFLTNPNVTKPDAQGILRIGPEGKQNIAGLLIGNYLLLTGVGFQQALLEAKSWTSGASTGSLAQRLGPEDLKRATDAPAWAYANIQIVAKMYGPTIQQKLKEAAKNLQQMQAKGGSRGRSAGSGFRSMDHPAQFVPARDPVGQPIDRPHRHRDSADSHRGRRAEHGYGQDPQLQRHAGITAQPRGLHGKRRGCHRHRQLQSGPCPGAHAQANRPAYRNYGLVPVARERDAAQEARDGCQRRGRRGRGHGVLGRPQEQASLPAPP